MKKYCVIIVVGVLFFGTMQAQTKKSAKETAVKIAERIVNSTSYLFENKKTGETFTTVKDLPLSIVFQLAPSLPFD